MKITVILLPLLLLSSAAAVDDGRGLISGCNRTISLLIKPCVCKDIVRQRPSQRTIHHAAAASGEERHYQYQSTGTWLNCQSQNLDDDRMSRILNIFLSSELNRNLTRRIYLPFNRLTQIPKEISLFRRLQKINLNHNKIVFIQTAYSDSSSDVTPRLIRLDFRSNRLNYIEAGAFLGRYSVGSYIQLQDNNLTRFESEVFQSVLEQMATYSGSDPYAYVDIGNNPIDCERESICHLAWIIRDHRHLLNVVFGAKCANGTWLSDLYLPAASHEDDICGSNSSASSSAANQDSSANLVCLAIPQQVIDPCKCYNYGPNADGTMLSLNCDKLNLSDDDVEEVLNAFAVHSRNISLLRHFTAWSNYLTRVPYAIRQFRALNQLNLANNRIVSILADDFDLFAQSAADDSDGDDRVILNLDNNLIRNIEPGAFEGSYFDRGSIYIDLRNNKLTRFESAVFQSLLENNYIFGTVYLFDNPMDCDSDPCHFEWYTRFNPYLAYGVAGLECADKGNPLLTITDAQATASLLLSSSIIRNNNTSNPQGADADGPLAVCQKLEEKNGYSYITISTSVLLGIIIAIVLFSILLISVVALVLHKYQAKKKKFKVIKDLLKSGNEKAIDPQKSLDEQWKLIPYDKRRWEFPKNRLRLGKELGSGEFGRVVKAEAVGLLVKTESSTNDGVGIIRRAEEVAAMTTTTVAVKMVRPQLLLEDQIVALKALVSELKVMIALESHLNVVNLMGACTRNISRGDLLLMVEYCRYGNLLSYISSARKRFINQVDSLGNLIKENENCRCSDTSAADYYFIPEVVNGRVGVANEMAVGATELVGDRRDVALMKAAADDDYMIDDELTGTVSTRDLIYWSFQIARAMDYLASKKVLHGDLAARNVLLTDDGVVKVADFGLARQLYHDDNYMKQSQGKLPVKWMAPESLTEMVFSSQSDVWSYGVVLWELFTLGKIPYPGMSLNQLICALQTGYRMDKPQLATNDIGQLMANCWKADPSDRPTFHQLHETLSAHLEASVIGHYLNLHDSYLCMPSWSSDQDADEFILDDGQHHHFVVSVGGAVSATAAEMNAAGCLDGIFSAMFSPSPGIINETW